MAPEPIEGSETDCAHCKVLQNAIAPLSAFQGSRASEAAGLHLAVGLVFISKSISYRTAVESSLACRREEHLYNPAGAEPLAEAFTGIGLPSMRAVR